MNTNLKLKAPSLSYLSSKQNLKLQKAFEYAYYAHDGQTRRSGEPYIIHPLAVTEILAEWFADCDSLCAGLLHDVLEDCDVSQQDFSKNFGKSIYSLVDAVTKLAKTSDTSADASLAKSFQAMAGDPRVILVKLADRLHNMRTISHLKREKQQRIARETLKIYAKIAYSFGLHSVYAELEDLSFKALHPVRYQTIKNTINTQFQQLKHQKLEKSIIKLCKGIDNLLIHTISKSPYRVYTALKLGEFRLKDKSNWRVGATVIECSNAEQCYTVLGKIHTTYKLIPNFFHDYISTPKHNGYKAIHTVVGTEYGKRRIVIKPAQKHKQNVFDTTKDGSSLWRDSITAGFTSETELVEDFLSDLPESEVYVFTPQGRLINLPKGATVLDFAFAVHTDIGLKALGCEIDGEASFLNRELKNGETVNIVSEKQYQCTSEWLDFLVTGKARHNVRTFLRQRGYKSTVQLGMRLLTNNILNVKVDLNSIDKQLRIKITRHLGVGTIEELLYQIGQGKKQSEDVVRILAQFTELKKSEGNNSLIIDNHKDKVILSKCCFPIPGDAIVGQLRHDLGLVVHQTNCSLISKNKTNLKFIPVTWSKTTAINFKAKLNIRAHNNKGLLAKITKAIADEAIELVSCEADTEIGGLCSFRFILMIQSRIQLAKLIKTIKRTKDVVNIIRGNEEE